MTNKNYDRDSQDKLSWLNSNFLLSFSLFFSTYTVLGWSIANQAILWAKFLHEQNIPIEIALEEDILLFLIKLFALLVIIIITFLLSTPVALTTFLFQESINSDLKGFLSILLWSVVLVFAFCSFDYFADFLVIISVNLLLRLDLKKLKYRNWQIILIILFFASIAFIVGVILFDFVSHH